MVVHKHSYIIGVGNGAVSHMRPGPRSVDKDTRSTERRVGEVTVVDGWMGAARHLDTVLTETGVVVGGIKLIIREKYHTLAFEAAKVSCLLRHPHFRHMYTDTVHGYSPYPRLGIQCPTLIYVMIVGSGLMRWVSF